MNKKFFMKTTGLVWLIFFIGTALRISAVEFREPLTVLNGPLRFLFEDASDECSFRIWTSAYGRFATKAFSNEHGRHFIDLPELLFLKSYFRPCQIFQDCLVRLSHQGYNPLLRTARFQLRADYSEVGCMVGFKWDYPFSTGSYSGRVGFRVQVPFKRCQIRKNDTGGVTTGSALEDVLKVSPMKTQVTKVTATTGATSPVNVDVNLQTVHAPAVRLDLMEALIQSPQQNSFLSYNEKNSTSGSAKHEVFAGTATASVVSPATLDILSSDLNSVDGASKNKAISTVAMVYSPEGFFDPDQPNFAVAFKEDANLKVDGSVNGIFQQFPADADIKDSGSMYVFKSNDSGDTVYANLADEADKSVEDRIRHQDNKATVWVIPFAQQIPTDTTGSSSTTTDVVPANSVVDSAKVLTEQISNNAYDVLKDNNLVFESFTVDNIGDLSGEAFFELTASDNFLLEVNATLVAPTSGKQKFSETLRSCYALPTGNGGHWEVAPGGRIAYRLGRYGSISADGKYHFVLNETVKRPAAYKNALVKNLAAPIDADVKWGYFVGKVTLNLTHPSTARITGTVGYEFFYKRKDQLKFLQDTHLSMMGDYKKNGKLINGEMDLSNDKAAENTNSISHRLVFETSYLLSDWVEFFWGGGWTFAGRNVPASMDSHAGFHVAF